MGLLMPAMPAVAHDPGLSAVTVRLGGGAMTAAATFARGEIGPSAVSEVLEIRIDGRLAEARDVVVTRDDSNAVHYAIAYPAFTGSRLALRSPIIARLARGHRQLLSVESDTGARIAEGMLDADHDGMEVDLGHSSERSEFAAFLVLGIEHIRTGYDHLLFLLGLLLLGGSLRSVAKIITSFTIAHSITPAAASLNVVQVPARVVEPPIAASIVWVGVENILRPRPDHRGLLALGFGLIHGFGFASALGDLGMGKGRAAVVPLVSFNLGVELGQIAIAALVLPLIGRVRPSPRFLPRLMPACSLLVALMGCFWLVQRVIGG